MGGWCGGKPWLRESAAMVGMRRGWASLMSAPSRPWPCGSGPIASRCSGVMPEVMKLIMCPVSSATPRAAYLLCTTSRAASAMVCSTCEKSSSLEMETMAVFARLQLLVQGVDAFLCLLALGDVSNHMRVAEQLAPVVSNGRAHDIGPEERAVLAHAPTLRLELAVARGPRQIFFRNASLPVF